MEGNENVSEKEKGKGRVSCFELGKQKHTHKKKSRNTEGNWKEDKHERSEGFTSKARGRKNMEEERS